MKVDSQQIQDASNPVHAAATVQRSQPSQLQENFLSLIFPPGSQLSPGPEPPQKASQPKADAEEAAISPNVKSQKPDSPHQEKKILTVGNVSSEDAQAAAVAGQSQGDQGKSGSPLAALPDQPKNIAIDEVVHLKEHSSFGENAVLPIDPDVPITDIRSFSIDAATRKNLLASSVLPSVQPAINPVVESKILSPQSDTFQATQATIGLRETEKIAAIPVGLATHSSAPSPVANPERKVEFIETSTGPKHESRESAGNPSASAPGHSSGFQHPSEQNSQSQSKPEKAADLSNEQAAGRKTLLSEVVTKFETMMASRPKDGVVVQLSPKALGTITLTLKTVGKALDTQISASNPEVRQALSDSRAELSSAIHESGYTVAGLSVNSDGQNQNQSQGQTSGDSQPAQPKIFSSAAQLQNGAIPLALSRYKAAAGVDLWI